MSDATKGSTSGRVKGRTLSRLRRQTPPFHGRRAPRAAGFGEGALQLLHPSARAVESTRSSWRPLEKARDSARRQQKSRSRSSGARRASVSSCRPAGRRTSRAARRDQLLDELGARGAVLDKDHHAPFRGHRIQSPVPSRAESRPDDHEMGSNRQFSPSESDPSRDRVPSLFGRGNALFAQLNGPVPSIETPCSSNATPCSLFRSCGFARPSAQPLSGPRCASSPRWRRERFGGGRRSASSRDSVFGLLLTMDRTIWNKPCT